MNLTILIVASLALQEPVIEDVMQTGLRTVSFTAEVGKAKLSELKKINQDFAQSYRFKKLDVWLKEPFKVRLESTVDDTSIVMVINGPKKLYRIPRANLKLREDLSKEPGKRQTAFDFGLITPSLFDGYFQAKYVRKDRRTGELIFDVTYVPSLKYKARHRIWVDPETKLVTKRQWYANRGGHLMATFEYLDPIQSGGVWFPTKVHVRNADNVLAGTTTYKNVKINVAIADKLFDAG